MDDKDLSPKATMLLQALEALCKGQGVQLTVAGEGVLELWPLQLDDDPAYIENVADHLGPAE
ncbi:MAG: hypothetical protein IV094_11810 [Vitreoscilla sp.]|nr:hypothetical protein [Vitreoscilla sp.]